MRQVDPNKLMIWPTFGDKAKVRICTITSSGTPTKHIAIETPLSEQQMAGEAIGNALADHGFAMATVQSKNFYVLKKPMVRFHEQSLVQWAQALFLPEYTSTNTPIREIFLPGLTNFAINQEFKRIRSLLQQAQQEGKSQSTAEEIPSVQPNELASESTEAKAPIVVDEPSQTEEAPLVDPEIEQAETASPADFDQDTAQIEEIASESDPIEVQSEPFELLQEDQVKQDDEADTEDEDAKTKRVKVQDVGEFLLGARKGRNLSVLSKDEIENTDIDTLRDVVRRDLIWPAISQEEAQEQGYSLFGYIFYKKLRSLISTVPRLSINGYQGYGLASELARKGEKAAIAEYLSTVAKVRDLVQSMAPFNFGDSVKNNFEFDEQKTFAIFMNLAVEAKIIREAEFNEEGRLVGWGGSFPGVSDLCMTAYSDFKKLACSSNVHYDFYKKFFKPFRVKIKDIQKKGLDKDVSFSFADLDEKTTWGDILAGKRAKKRDDSDSEDSSESNENEAETEGRQTISDIRKTELVNLPYSGPDFLKTKDFSSANFAQEFMDTFGLKGVQFGNWLTEKEKLEFVKRTYSSCMLLCRVVGIAPSEFGLGGTLGIAFGSQGRKGAAAHYNPAYKNINLTRFSGDGSLAHEWAHALDNFLYDRVLKNFGAPRGIESEYKFDLLGPSRISLLSDVYTTKSRIGRSSYFHFTGMNRGPDNLIECVANTGAYRNASYEDLELEANLLIDFKKLVRSLFDRPVSISDEISSALANASYMRREALGANLTKLRKGAPEEYAALEKKYYEKTGETEGFNIYRLLDLETDLLKDLAKLIAIKASEIAEPGEREEIENNFHKFNKFNDWLESYEHLKEDYTPIHEFRQHNDEFYRNLPSELKLRGSKYSAILTDFNERSKDADRKRSGPMYFATPVELLARSFETYVAKALKVNGYRDDFLVQESKLEGHVYPKGKYGDIIFTNWEKVTEKFNCIFKPNPEDKITLGAQSVEQEQHEQNAPQMNPSI